MRVCLICTEFLGWGAAGGYGFVTRITGEYLAERGIDTHAVIPQPRDINERETSINGVKLKNYPRLAFAEGRRLFASCDADIYMSFEPSLGSWLAQKAMPRKRHIVSFQDPRLFKDWWIEFIHPTLSKKQVLMTCLYYDNPLTRSAVHGADHRVVPANFLIEKAKRKYKLDSAPTFLPTPVKMPVSVEKSERPTVCCVGRWDRRKRLEIFFELAKDFPDVTFIAPGVAQDAEYDAQLRKTYGSLPNVEMPGFLDQFKDDRLSKVYESSWILVNTAAREGLPNTFIEACGHRCAILSPSDPDKFASRFGCFVGDGDFGAGMRALLTDDRWRDQAEKGYAYVRDIYDAGRAIDAHVNLFESVL